MASVTQWLILQSRELWCSLVTQYTPTLWVLLQPNHLYCNLVNYVTTQLLILQPPGVLLQPMDLYSSLRTISMKLAPPPELPPGDVVALRCVCTCTSVVFREFCYYCTIAISTTSQDVDVYRLVCSRYLHAASVVVNGTGVFTPSEHYVDSESG